MEVSFHRCSSKKLSEKTSKGVTGKQLSQILFLIEGKQLWKVYFSWLSLQKWLRYRYSPKNLPKCFWETLFRGFDFSVKHALCKRKLHVNSSQKLVSASLLQNNYFGIFCKSHLTLCFLSKVAGLQLFAKTCCYRSCCSLNFAKNFRSAAFYNITGRITPNATKTNKTTNKARKLRKIGHIIPTSQVKLIKYRSKISIQKGVYKYISQYLRENTCATVSYWRDYDRGVFLWILWNF